MIVNSVMFFNELELLDIRLHELRDVVDRFVIVESPITHSGKPKPLYFDENRHNFSEFLGKIFHVVVDDMPREAIPSIYGTSDDFYTSSWTREGYQRGMGLRGMADLNDDDVVIVTDADEIPSSSSVIITSVEHDLVYQFDMMQYEGYLNRKWSTSIWTGGMTTFKTAKKVGLNRIKNRHLDNGELRRAIIPSGGWHFSWMGGYDRINLKARSFAHIELQDTFSKEYVEKMFSDGLDVWGRSVCRKVSIDESYPAYLRENTQKFTHLIL